MADERPVEDASAEAGVLGDADVEGVVGGYIEPYALSPQPDAPN
jgi:hypothetical protein